MARRSARAAAVQMVYENMLGGDGGEDTLLHLIEFEPSEEERLYIDTIVEGVKNEQTELDEIIQKYLTNWTIERIAKVDLSILRVAVYEIKHHVDDVSKNIICAEALSLAKRFSAENSGRFVNGVVGAYARDVDEEK